MISQIFVVLAFIIAGFSYYRIKNISLENYKYIDKGYILFQKGDSTVLGYATFLCPLASISVYGIFPEIEFLPFCILLVFSVILLKVHGNTESALFSEISDLTTMASYFVCLAFAGFLKENDGEFFYIIVLSYSLVYVWHLIGKMDALENLFRRYLAKSIDLETENKELKEKLEKYENSSRI